MRYGKYFTYEVNFRLLKIKVVTRTIGLRDHESVTGIEIPYNVTSPIY